MFDTMQYRAALDMDGDVCRYRRIQVQSKSLDGVAEESCGYLAALALIFVFISIVFPASEAHARNVGAPFACASLPSKVRKVRADTASSGKGHRRVGGQGNVLEINKIAEAVDVCAQQAGRASAAITDCVGYFLHPTVFVHRFGAAKPTHNL